MVGEKECCICFSLESESGEITDKICNNHKCRRYFHSSCLFQVFILLHFFYSISKIEKILIFKMFFISFQWLQELVTNKIVFNTIVGPCPNCGEEIPCDVPSSK